MTGLTTTRLTTHPPGAEPAPPVPLCAADAAELVFTSDVAETAASDASVHSNTDTNAQPIADATPDSWRVEVAARLERYRTRRKPRTPRYPSLLLPFDAPETWSRPTARTNSGADLSSAPQEEPSTPETAANIRAMDAHEASQTSEQSRRLEQITEQSAKVIEFPRSAAIPVF